MRHSQTVALVTRSQDTNTDSTPYIASSCSSKIYSGKATIDMSNDLQPTKSGYHGISGQSSQIPGLSPAASSAPEEKARGRRVGVLETDTDYVKLAKQGGQKDLLWHEEAVTSIPNSYKPPDWFCPAATDIDGTSSLVKNKEKQSPGAFPLLEPPFGTDDMSAWEWGDSSNRKEKQHNVPNQMLSTQYHETSKFKRIILDKKPAPVNMSKLLSFGYAEDDKPTADSDVSKN